MQNSMGDRPEKTMVCVVLYDLLDDRGWENGLTTNQIRPVTQLFLAGTALFMFMLVLGRMIWSLASDIVTPTAAVCGHSDTGDNLSGVMYSTL